MRPGQKISLSRDQSVMAAVTSLGLVVFCYFSGFPLIIPLLVFFFGLQLFYFRKAGVRLFLHLALLLALLAFAANAVKSYSHPAYLYLPIASVGMLTMLLFN